MTTDETNGWIFSDEAHEWMSEELSWVHHNLGFYTFKDADVLHDYSLGHCRNSYLGLCRYWDHEELRDMRAIMSRAMHEYQVGWQPDLVL